ncbi:MAG: hypothetical protein K2W97_06460 [Chthoniobacterales bacterium]|nr:hypothetical protein [Chthoniobacterales bacterium]
MNPRLKNIALTYAPELLMDGSGSQLHRIYGVYALSRAYNIPYVHSPLEEIGYQGVRALEENENNLELVARYNKVFHINSDVDVPSDAIITTQFYAEEKLLLEQIKKAEQNPSDFFLVRIGFPMTITDAKPVVFEHARTLSPFPKKISSAFRVAIHVRWGDLLIDHQERLLPNDYYIATATKVIQMLEKWEIPFVCELHTEMPSASFMVTPQHHGVKNRIEEYRLKESVMLTPEQYRVSDFEVIPNLHKRINEDPIETLEALATADFLIMSKSSFSYLAALFNQDGKSLYAPFWHPPMSDWLRPFPRVFFEEQLEEYCEQWLGHVIT